MGNNNLRSINFKQSLNDFPLTVGLGKKTPSWGLSRWKENQGLRFVPFDDEGFSLRGDRRQLLYKGNRRSHRFTILNDGAFEYDCILNREPESNIISLRMEGAENFDFFRQPNFVSNPFLKGSYAVYLKDTFIGQGTGKLCHIHRPLIIDSLGRKCWGVLSVVCDELRITIPKDWLSNAKYPVVIDPTIGTTTLGSQYIWYDEDNEEYRDLFIEIAIPVNRFLVPETINGLCTAFFYTNKHDGEAGGRPVLYSDNNNVPQTRKSSNESFIDLRFVNGNNAGWRSGSFNGNGVTAGSYIWFGLYSEYMWLPRFDYGMKCYRSEHDVNGVPNSYPLWSANWYDNFKLSMYFTYVSSQNYIRTLTQGVKISDTQKKGQNFKRINLQNVKGATENKHNARYIRKTDDNIAVNTTINRLKSIIQKIIDTVNNYDVIKQLNNYIRNIYIEALTTAKASKHFYYYSLIQDNVNVDSNLLRSFLIFVKLLVTTTVRDFVLHRFLIAKDEIALKSCITREIILESRIC